MLIKLSQSEEVPIHALMAAATAISQAQGQGRNLNLVRRVLTESIRKRAATR